MNLGGRGMGASKVTSERLKDAPDGAAVFPDAISDSISRPNPDTLFSITTPASGAPLPRLNVTSFITFEGTRSRVTIAIHAPYSSRSAERYRQNRNRRLCPRPDIFWN